VEYNLVMDKTPEQEIVDIVGYNYHVREYSGRGMYGDKCLGIVTDDIIKCVVDVMLECSEENRIDIGEMLRGGVTDSMGRSEILYFPKIEWNPDWEEGEDEY